MLEVGIVLEPERGGIRLALEIVEADVVGALDSHGHRLGRTVDGGHRERVGQRAAGVQRLDRGIALVERIRPRAAGRHREAAVAVIARLRTGHCRERVVRVVDVPVGQGAARAGRRVAGSARLDHAAARVAADDGCVVAAFDRDGHRLRGSVDGLDDEGVGERLAHVERLESAIAVVERVGPMPVGGHGEAAVAVVARMRTGHRHKGVRRVVDVGIGQ